MKDFIKLVGMTQKEVKQELINRLQKAGYKTQTHNGFIYAPGTVPVLLIAHMDTVHKQPAKTVCISTDGNTVMSPEGIGGDDRAGIYIILRLLEQVNCHILFCEDEEIGGIGASKFANSRIKPDVNYIVEFDRRGSDDAVFYDCDNKDFTDFVCQFGFKERFGSFSDISIIAPALGIAAVNLSAGYYCEHTKGEYVRMDEVENIIANATNLLQAESDRFKYVERAVYYDYANWKKQYYPNSFYDSGYYKNEYEDDAFDTMFDKSELVEAMELPDGAYVLYESDLMEDYTFRMDSCGMVYDYIEALDVYYPMIGAGAYTHQGTPVRFDYDNTEVIEVIEAEAAARCLDTLDLYV